ncbi:hypothetical protein FRB97_004478, partial [Tulasnella sp. 331]
VERAGLTDGADDAEDVLETTRSQISQTGTGLWSGGAYMGGTQTVEVDGIGRGWVERYCEADGAAEQFSDSATGKKFLARLLFFSTTSDMVVNFQWSEAGLGGGVPAAKTLYRLHDEVSALPAVVMVCLELFGHRDLFLP